jgi:hypothetical protein
MKPETVALSMLALPILLVPVGLSQELQPKPPDSSKMEAKASPAIAWSEMQRPQPLSSATQTFTGTVVKLGDKYVLRTTDNATYQFDDPNKVKRFEAKLAQVRGETDATGKVIQIQNVEVWPADP